MNNEKPSINQNYPEYSYKLTPFKLFTLQNFPYIEADFDAITNYQLFCKVVEYLNEVIANENTVESIVQQQINNINVLYNWFLELDVQDEINNKLDAMAEDGTLTNLISRFMEPYIEEFNRRLDIQDNKVNAVENGSPLVASSTAGMTDTSRIYVNTSDGYWYYYNGTEWTRGNVYQATGFANLSIGYNKLKGELNVDNYVETTWIDGAICSKNNTEHAEGDILIDSAFKRSEPILLRKGMILIVDSSISNLYNSISKVDANNNFLSTIHIGNSRATQTYKATENIEYVCICRNYNANCYISIYTPDFNFNKTLNIGGYVSSINNTSMPPEGRIVNATHPWTSTPQNNRYLRTNLIPVKKGNVFKCYLGGPNTINLLSYYNENLEYVDGVKARGNCHLFDFNYIVPDDGYVVLSNDITIVSNYHYTFYENLNDYVEDDVIWNSCYVLDNIVTSVGNLNYATTNEILLKKGDVIDYYSISRSNNCFKLSIWYNGENTSGFIENNENTSSEYYKESLRGQYIATQDCFVRVTNQREYLPDSDTEINTYKYNFIKYTNIYNKIVSVIGDSYVKNQHDNIGLTWHNRLASKYGASYNNYGINGNGLVANATGTPVVSRLDVIDSNSDLVIVIGGKNDYNQQLPIEEFETGLRSICTNLINSFYNKKIVFFTPWDSYGTNDNKSIKLYEYVESIKKICNEYSIPVFDSYHNSNMYMWFNPFKEEFNQSPTDISHLNKKGHLRFLNQAEKFVISL